MLVNTGSNISVLLVKLAITFIMTPVFVYNMGKHDYGIWEIITAVIGYMGMLDLGLRPAITRFSAKYHAEKLQEELQTLYSTSWAFMGFIGFVIFLLFIGWALLWPEKLSANGESESKYIILLVIIGARLLFTFPGFVAESFLEGFQKYSLKNNITIVSSIIGATLVYANISTSNGIIVLASVNIIMLTSKYLLYTFLMSRPELGGFRPNVARASWQCFTKIAAFGSKSFVQGVATRMEQATDTLVIGILLGPAIVPFYSIPLGLVRYISTMGMNLTHAFMPLFSSLNARQQHDKVVLIYINASKMVIGVIMPLAAGVAVVGAPFIGIWIGDEYSENADGIILLLVTFISVPFFNPFYSRYLTAIGEHGFLAKLSPMSAVVNLTLSVFLVREYGIIGAALGSVVPVFLFVPIYLKRTCYHLGIPVFQYVKKCIIPPILPVATMVCLLLLFRVQHGITNYVDILLAVVLGGSVYGILFWVISLNDFEKNFVKHKLAFMRAGRFK